MCVLGYPANTKFNSPNVVLCKSLEKTGLICCKAKIQEFGKCISPLSIIFCKGQNFFIFRLTNCRSLKASEDGKMKWNLENCFLWNHQHWLSWMNFPTPKQLKNLFCIPLINSWKIQITLKKLVWPVYSLWHNLGIVQGN